MPIARILAGLDQLDASAEIDQEHLRRLADSGQWPEVLFIGCSDARMPMEMFTRLDPGALFVTRNVANIVPPYGTGQMGVGAVIEYAVLHLRVKHIMIVGHTDCGGIKFLDQTPNWRDTPHIARWIEHARPAKTKVDASGLPEEARHLATVRENVLLQLENLRTYDPVRDGERAERLLLHGWVYCLEEGYFEAYDPASKSWGAPRSDRE